MFLENSEESSLRTGWIEVICGSMFSGKTEEMIRRINRAKIAKQKVQIFKPSVDNRFDAINVVSHNSIAVVSTPVETAEQILLYMDDANVIGIDEAQFFDSELVNVCNQLADKGMRVIVAGLDMDYLGKPFGPIPQLMATAEYVTKVHAICMSCGSLAHFSHRTVVNDKLVMLGEIDNYEPLCRKCYNEIKR